jgi:hypothetical protein
MEATMMKLKTLMITSIVIIAMASPILAKDVVTGPDNGGYYSTNAHHGQGQQLGGKSGEKSAKGLNNASTRSKGVSSRSDGAEKTPK